MIFKDEGIKHIHCLGIGGIGVSALAEILLRKGYRITGSDIAANENTQRLQCLGADIIFNHDNTVVTQADCAVYSSAITPTNPEFLLAQSSHIPLLKRGELLAQVMLAYQSIAVAGAHGKTTTTGMLANAFMQANLDPTFMVGGALNAYKTPARVGAGNYFIAEADESDASFLFMKPNVSIITNIDADHLCAYRGDFNRLKQAYIQFINQMPSEGLAVLCMDDPVIQELIPKLSQRIITYGFSPKANYRIDDYLQKGTQGFFRIYRPGNKTPLSVCLNMPGQHNALNASAVMVVTDVMGMDESASLQSFLQFAGVERRFAIRGEMQLVDGSALIVEDYGHHPKEIDATLAAARAAWPNRRIVLVFQPHRYTRTRDLMAEFATVLSKPDFLVLLEVYGAGELPILGADGQSLLKAIEQKTSKTIAFEPSIENINKTLRKFVKADDIILLQGAGSIGSITTTLLKNDN